MLAWEDYGLFGEGPGRGGKARVADNVLDFVFSTLVQVESGLPCSLADTF